MANEYAVNKADLTSVADAIRTKGETSAQLAFPSDFVTAIQGIKTGVELNFEVIGGTTQPSNPKENTIWVNTNTEIAGWTFSVEQPTSPAAGMVWFFVGTSSMVEFNALQENSLRVYPVSAKQYDNSAWKPVPALTYKNGDWVRWAIDFITNGEQFVSEYSKVKATITKENTTVKIAAVEDSHFIVNFACNDCAGRTIYMEIEKGYLSSSGNYTCGIALSKTPVNTYAEANAGVARTDVVINADKSVVAKTYELKIPSSFTSGYFAIHAEPYSGTGYINIKNLYIE